MRRCAIEAMTPYLEQQFANPSGAHRMARKSRAAVDDAREVVAKALGFDPHGVVFTSGGTEADNLAVHGVTSATGTTALCPATEHHAVLHPVEAVGGRYVQVDAGGDVDLDHLAAQLAPDAGPPVGLVSVMLVNNESGVIADLDAVADVIGRHAPEALLHTDAVQGVNWVDIAAAARSADLLSLSGHKFGGPKGVGVLAIRPGVTLSAQQLGGGQEADRRSGTHNTAGIAALGAALGELNETRDEDICRIRELADRLADGLLAAIDGCTETVARSRRAAGICQLLIDGIETEALLVLLDRFDVMASAAASCASGAMEPSHVLAAMGVERQTAAGSLRLSLGWCTEPWEIERAIDAIPNCVEQLR
ncbi:MAG: aminotransferase class V-fold PLP-dependent enzyme [Acidimicrobiales bacterium]|nr:aminotransferase class V-fold PLP-dependent enzyme [Acidimicrobiales bacterium]MYA25762.1 aminotransferase class V-fold PLP-dependent enzyme [Acidimicrobiales bacterium]MYD82772.1 aminotransferase class V-fold PLP-dependent enzyme [Acidimicrobiales bacterium]MYG87231.1 aminotransferase class V-fold PLP-dependent enzyme [Acidimicrobiales bacterium]MYI26479.1 aminotransferase class V-fold PLP-dependent enzyme [Acidimicrobiales bacterium]